MSETLIRIGLVEDDPRDVELFQEMLREPPDIQFELILSARLDQALEMLQTEILDVLLLDLWLPDCQGLEVFHKIKSHAPDTPIIIFSGRNEKDLAIRAVADGAQDYLVKGQINAHTLKRAIHYAIERQRVVREELAKTMFASAAAGITTLTLEGNIIQANPAFCKMLGYSEADLRKLNFASLTYPDDLASNLALIDQLLAGRINDFTIEKRYIKKSGGIIWASVRVSLVRSAAGNPSHIIAVCEDISERKRLESFRLEQSAILEHIAAGAPLPEILESAVRLVESQYPLSFCSVLLLDADGLHLRHGAAPSLPPAYCKAIDGVKIGPRVGSCGTAAFERRTVVVEDIARDILWTDYKDLAIGYGLRACWSIPIFSSSKQVLGTLAIYSGRSRSPEPGELELAAICANMAGIAIERHQSLEQRMQREEDLAKEVTKRRILFEQAVDAIVVLNQKQEVVEANASFANALGYTLEEVLKLHPWDWDAIFSSKKKILAAWPELTREHEVFETKWRHRDGTIFDVEISTNPTHWAGQELLLCVCRDITQRKQAEVALRESEARFKSVTKATTDAVWDWNLKTDILWWGEGMQTLFGYSLKEIEPDSKSWTKRIHPADKSRVLKGIHQVIDGSGEKWSDEYRFMRKDGSFAHVMDRGFVIRDDAGKPMRMVGGIADITKSKRAELELNRLNRALRMLSACNEALIRASNESQLLNEICRIVVEIGGYHMSWVGYAEDNPAKSIKPVGYAGPHKNYLSKIKVSWSEKDPTGMGPAGKAIRSGAPEMCEDVTQDADFAPWLAAAKKYGYRGVTCLPLNDKDRTFGVLALHAAEVRSFPDDEIRLLQEMADDLAFGITNLRAQYEAKRIHSAVLKVATGVSATTGTEFFEQLTRNMVEALDAQVGMISQVSPGKPLSARTIALIVDGKAIDSLEYILAGTPCEHVMNNTGCVFERGVQQRFPEDLILKEWDVHAYIGTQLKTSKGEIIGFMSVLFREAVKTGEFINSTLQIFATRAAAELERRETDLRVRNQASLLDKAKDAIIVRGLDHTIHYWNKGAERLYGWTAQEAIGSSIKELLYDDPTDFLLANANLLKQGDWLGEISQRHKDRSTLVIEGHWTLVKNDAGENESILAINTDISQRKAVESEMQHMAFYDPLTGLSNRLLLLDRLQQVLVGSVRSKQCGALLFIDLDNFKSLNDTVGHDVGDLLLKEVAARLTSCVRESDTVARLGGDEFVILLEDLGENMLEAAAHAKSVGEKILSCFIPPFELRGYPHHSTPSIGVTLFNDQLTDVEELLKRADLAMYQAKASGRNTMRFFDPEMQAIINERVELEADLRQGLQYSEFQLHYQPQLDSEGHVIGAEALCRWQHPKRGMVPPVQFIPVAEDTGLILLLGYWVLETACLQLVAWTSRPETASLIVAINVSARQFRQPDFVEQVIEVLKNTGANPNLLKFELTESVLVENIEEIIGKMVELKSKGVRFSLDDFGTGYSSLSYLKRMPLDQLKIDQSFVRDVLTDANDAAIARTIITLGQSLGLRVIAEGVETEEQRKFLELNGCKAYQGYLFSRPLPIEQFNAFVSERAFL